MSATCEFLKRRFQNYYKECDLYLPNRFGKKEFGFRFFDTQFVHRHLNFATKSALRQYLVDRVPSHVYHSGAYYTRPGAPNMALKNWLGSDLIFDLDADHIPGTEKLAFEEKLVEVKRHTKRLIDSFLVDDLGFDEKDMLVRFSGQRGYHVHVHDPRVWTLTSHERREIVDYVNGTGIEAGSIFMERPVRATASGLQYKIYAPSPNDGGWRGRIARGLMRELKYLASIEESESIAILKRFKGIGDVTACGIVSLLSNEERYANIEGGNLGMLPEWIIHRLTGIVEKVVASERVQIDKVVTSDAKRLIRLPLSLHGGTGFRVIPLSRKELDDFDPLNDAIPSTWTDVVVKVTGRADRTFRLKSKLFTVADGESARLPGYAAIFALCRGLATKAGGV